LCLWILGLSWDVSRKRALAVLPLALLAWMAHALPVVWVASVLAYLYAVRRISGPWRSAAPLGGVAVLVAVQSFLMSHYPYRWSLEQTLSPGGIGGMIGVEQLWLYDSKYLILSGAVSIVLLLLLLERMDQGGMLTDPIVQLWSLHVVALVLMPSAILLPQYQHVLAYIPQRLSLLT